METDLRRWMRLVESTDAGLLGAVQRAAQSAFGRPLSEVPEEAEAYYGTDEISEAVAIIADDLKKLFGSGHAKLFRCLNLPDTVLKTLTPGTSLGPLDQSHHASWTSDFDALDFDGMGTIHAVHAETNLFLIQATVPFATVDLPLSVAHRIEYQWEMEVSLLRGHPLRLDSIHRCDGSGQTLEEVRADLRGATMRS